MHARLSPMPYGIPAHADSSINVIVGVSVGCISTLLFLIITATLVLCCIRHMRQREQRKSDWTKDIFVTDDVLHITGSGVIEKSAKNQALLHSEDPLEFPRNKLVFLNTILGKEYTIVPRVIAS